MVVNWFPSAHVHVCVTTRVHCTIARGCYYHVHVHIIMYVPYLQLLSPGGGPLYASKCTWICMFPTSKCYVTCVPVNPNSFVSLHYRAKLRVLTYSVTSMQWECPSVTICWCCWEWVRASLTRSGRLWPPWWYKVSVVRRGASTCKLCFLAYTIVQECTLAMFEYGYLIITLNIAGFICTVNFNAILLFMGLTEAWCCFVSFKNIACALFIQE